jgi:hypothetical protein
MVKIKLNNHNVVVSLSLKDSIKDVQSSLQNTITWIKKSGKGNMNGLEQVQRCIYLLSKITNSYQNSIHMSKLILFPKSLEFKDAINLCYSKQKLFCIKTKFLHGLSHKKCWKFWILQSYNVFESISRWKHTRVTPFGAFLHLVLLIHII